MNGVSWPAQVLPALVQEKCSSQGPHLVLFVRRGMNPKWRASLAFESHGCLHRESIDQLRIGCMACRLLESAGWSSSPGRLHTSSTPSSRAQPRRSGSDPRRIAQTMDLWGRQLHWRRSGVRILEAVKFRGCCALQDFEFVREGSASVSPWDHPRWSR
jgi:hypothetical protein